MFGLSNSSEEKLQFTPFWVGPKPSCPDSVRAGSEIENVNFCTLESNNFFVLGSILVKLHIRTRLIESFPQTFHSWWCAEEKLHFTPFHTLRPLKRDEALFPPVHNKVTMYARLTHFLHFRMLLFFSLTSYPGEIAYFNSPNGELSVSARVMELY